ncbi:NADPH-dependent FMN reductase [Janthinobacterium sp. UMAB-56]|uniref:NADPH-dependent FMN reductase n=1 Tax=Janthinobacterium sp. UMAB-56 TaxID=1365361 RepID=UPI001C568660|nr:NAD(P)H-dependent oxidoreductase [Janthinobacterium sp. UMAB-56]
MKILLFLGSIRTSTPPRPARLGERVARACAAQCGHDGTEVVLIDPLDYALGEVFKPHFAYAQGRAPLPLEHLASEIASADGYVMVSPEYNHSMSPALAHLLNHFGSSLFAYKPSAIVTYSAGQWGGVRAAVGMRAFLSELGCLPVSAMIHIPAAHTVFTADGSFAAEVDGMRWIAYMQRTFAQLLWWAAAARGEREHSGVTPATPAFLRDPSQRNAP